MSSTRRGRFVTASLRQRVGANAIAELRAERAMAAVHRNDVLLTADFIGHRHLIGRRQEGDPAKAVCHRRRKVRMLSSSFP